MKTFNLVWLCFFCFLLHSKNIHSEPISADSTLSNADRFSFGMVGFVGYISPAESAYEQILTSADAESRFWSIYRSTTSSSEAKLYAACGLKTLSSKKFEDVSKELSKSKDLVTTMKGEALRQEKISELILKINKFSCK